MVVVTPFILNHFDEPDVLILVSGALPCLKYFLGFKWFKYSMSFNMQMQQREKKEPRSMSNLEKFLSSYGNYLTESTSINMDLDSVVQDVSANILNPNSEKSEIKKLYNRGINLRKENGSDLVPKLKNLKEDKVYDIVMFIEQLNNQLNREYEQEVRKGIQLGIYDRNDKKSL